MHNYLLCSKICLCSCTREKVVASVSLRAGARGCARNLKMATSTDQPSIGMFIANYITGRYNNVL